MKKNYFLIFIIISFRSTIHASLSYERSYEISFPPSEYTKQCLQELAKIPVYAFIKDFAAVSSWDDVQKMVLSENVPFANNIVEKRKSVLGFKKDFGAKLLAYLFLYKLSEWSQYSLMKLFHDYNLESDETNLDTDLFSYILERMLNCILYANKKQLFALRFVLRNHAQWEENFSPKLVEEERKEYWLQRAPAHPLNTFFFKLHTIPYLLGTVLSCSPQYFKKVSFSDVHQLQENRVNAYIAQLKRTVQLPNNKKDARIQLETFYPFLQSDLFGHWKEDILLIKRITIKQAMGKCLKIQFTNIYFGMTIILVIALCLFKSKNILFFKNILKNLEP